MLINVKHPDRTLLDPRFASEIESILHCEHFQHRRKDVPVAAPDHMFVSNPIGEQADCCAGRVGRSFGQHGIDSDVQAERRSQRSDCLDASPIRTGPNIGDMTTGHVEHRAGNVGGLMSTAPGQGAEKIVAVEIGP